MQQSNCVLNVNMCLMGAIFLEYLVIEESHQNLIVLIIIICIMIIYYYSKEDI